MEEILLIDKPKGWTSFDVVAKIRGKIRSNFAASGEKPTKKQLRVGHTGTLDPFATGLLIILIGESCKRSDEFLKLDKTYEFTARLGYSSTTGDPEGEVTLVSELRPSKESVQEALDQFKGTISQVPPSFSAIKINGKRAYQLAREGKKVDMPSRSVRINSLKLTSYEYPYIRAVCDVSSGTYVRTLVEDIGRALGVGAYCTELRRTRIGDTSIEDAEVLSSLVN